MLNTLAAWLVLAMTTWAPIRYQVARGESPVHALARYESIAEDIAAVTIEQAPSNAPRTALLQAALAFVESSYWQDVDEGRCRRELGARCDEGQAYGLLQIHPEDGIVLLDDGKFTFARERRTAPVVIHGEDLVRDRRLTFRVGIAMVKTAGVSLWTPGKQARDLATAWYQRHAFVAP